MPLYGWTRHLPPIRFFYTCSFIYAYKCLSEDASYICPTVTSWPFEYCSYLIELWISPKWNNLVIRSSSCQHQTGTNNVLWWERHSNFEMLRVLQTALTVAQRMLPGFIGYTYCFDLSMWSLPYTTVSFSSNKFMSNSENSWAKKKKGALKGSK